MIPVDPSSITAEWLSEVLGADVQAMQGRTDRHRRRTARPVVPGTPRRRAGPAGDGRREASHARHHGAGEPLRGRSSSTCARSASTRRSALTNPLRPARHYFAAFDEATHDFVLVLEDLGRLRLADQIVGLHRVDDAETVIDAIARHHAYWWDNDRLASLPWLKTYTTPPFSTVDRRQLRGRVAEVRRARRLRPVPGDA